MSCFRSAAMTSARERCSRTRAFSPTTLNVPRIPRGEDLGHPLGGVVAGRKEVVLGVEPEDHPHLGLGGPPERCGGEQEAQQGNAGAPFHPGSGGPKLHLGRSATVRPSTRADTIRSSHPRSSSRWAARSKPK